MNFLNSLLKEFPDACIIWPHRDPAKAVTSMASLSYLYRQPFSNDVDPIETGRFQHDAMSAMTRRALSHRDAHGDKTPFYDLQYQDLVTNPLEEIRKIYEYFSFPFSQEMEQSVSTWVKENPQNKHGRHTYSPETYGLSNEQIRQDFRDYTDRFSIPEESP